MIRKTTRALTVGLAVAVAALALLLGPRPAFAIAVDLRPDLSAPNGRVTLGDLFEDAGAASNVEVAVGGQTGGSLVLDARRVQALAAAHGLEWSNVRGLGRLIARVDSGSTRESRSSRSVRGGEVLTYARDFVAGDIVEAEDIVWASPSGFGAPIDAPRDARAVIGEAARRPLRAGTAVSRADLSPPKVIKRDELVSVAYSAGGVKLVLQGKAMSAAAVGEAVDIMNPGSKKVIQAVAIGPDEAVVGPDAERARASGASNPKLFASLN
ncbi:MAG TPA: flagellar basal body P-ring formation chaperone FlgA [Caulobacteraceae bacterium]